MAAEGGDGRRSAAGDAKRNKRQRQLRQKKKQEEQRSRLTAAAEDLSALLSHLTTAASLSFRFVAENDLLLRPSQSLSLDSSLLSAALSISKLHSLLPAFTTLNTLPPPAAAEEEESLAVVAAATTKSNYWFLRFLASAASASDPRWLETFRMSRPSFYLLLQTLSPSLSSSASSSSHPVPPDHRLGAALFRLAHAAPFLTVARRFGFDGPAPACRAFYEVCRAVSDQLGHLFEISSDLTRVVQGFNWISLPNCCGVLAFAHFPIERGGDRDRSTIITQALVDSEGRFLDVSAGWPGSMHPSQILPMTKLFSAHAKELSGSGGRGNGPCKETGDGIGASLPRYFLGNPCCPLLPWLLTSFPESDVRKDSSRRVFNDAHARGMELASKAFGVVRARWRLLSTRWKGECVEALPFVIVASCLLHNFLFKCREPVPEEVEESAMEQSQRFPDFQGKRNEDGERVRQVLASHLRSVGRP